MFDWRALLLTLAIGLSFADASIAALALPDIYAAFDTTIVGVSWVLVAYALAVAVAGAVTLLVVGRLDPRRLAGSGLALFAAGSLVAGLAGSLPVLLGARAAQGIGAAGLLAGSLPILAGLLGSGHAARARWALAGTVGALIGPALGGLVTQVLDWRAVFVLQAPVAVVALAGLTARGHVLLPAGGVLRPPPGLTTGRPPARSRVLLADLAYVGVFGALVGALFLGVLLLVVVWDLPPLTAALVVSALPVAGLAARPLARHSLPVVGVAVGAIGLAGGLVGLALLPRVDAWWAVLPFALCGVGFGLLSDALGPVAVPEGPDAARDAARSSAARHAGLVVGLLLIAPVVASSVLEGAEEAAYLSTATMLDSPASLARKVRIAWDLRDEIDATPEGAIPDLDGVFAANAAGDDADVARLRDDVGTAIAGAVTRSFRPAFLVAAALAALSAVPAVLAVRRRSSASARAPTGRAAPVVTGASLVAVVLAVPAVAAAYSRAGADELGRYVPTEPCTAPVDPFPGGGFDATLQRALQSGLYGAACELGTTREALVLSLDSRSGVDDVTWDADTLERALKAGTIRSLEDADDRDSVPGWLAWTLQEAVERAPLSWLLDRLG